MLITLSGLDGAGKSTLIEGLKTALEKQNTPVTVLHLTEHVGLYAYLRSLRDRVKLAPSCANSRLMQGEERSRKSGSLGKRPAESSWLMSVALCLRRFLLWNKPIRRCIYPVDVLIFLFYRLYIEKVTKQILIMDRYFYDTLADLSDGRSSPFVRFCTFVTPTPNVPIFVDVNPAEAYARKGEYSVTHLTHRRTKYQRIFTRVRGSVVLVNDELNPTERILEKLVMERIAEQTVLVEGTASQ